MRVPEPCMCGATDCSICGPLQSYSACWLHNEFDCDCDEQEVEQVDDEEYD